MAYDTFLKIETPNVAGESTASGFTGQIEIYSFSWGASQPVTIGSGTTGAGAGKVSLSDFSIMKKQDKASPLLFQACCKGQHYGKFTFTFRKAGTKPIVYLEFILEEVYVSSYQLSGSSGGDDAPTESVSLAFGKVTYNYYPQLSTGGQDKVVPASYDLRTVVTT